MFRRIRTLWKISGIEFDEKDVAFPHIQAAQKLANIIKPKKKLATIIDMQEPLEEFPPKEA